jgi:CBS domain-containing protein
MEIVSEIMDRKLVAVSHDASLKSALKLAKISGVDILPILENNRLVGILSVDEIQHYVSGNPSKGADSVKKLSKQPVFLEANETKQSAIDKIIKTGLTRVPVVENKSTMRCIGTVDSTNLLKTSANDQGN